MESLTFICLWMLFLPFSTSDNLPECSEVEKRSATSWISHENSYLSGHVIKVLLSGSPLNCGHHCLKHSWCISVNYKLDSGQCELNDFGVSPSDVFVAGKLTRKLGFIFYQFATPIKSCHDDLCKNGGTCVAMTSRSLFGTERCEPSEPKCMCVAGFYGDVCQHIDECVSNLCQNGATCVDGNGNYTCSCVAGFSGITCETDIDDCAVNPCQNDGTCTDGINSFTCLCPAEYTGDKCETVLATVLSFPDKSISNNVLYNGVLPNLTQFAVCMWINISAPGPLGIFSYRPGLHSVNLGNSYLMLLIRTGGQLALSAGGKEYEFNSNITRDGKWHPLCVGWALLHGNVDVYYDGKVAGSIMPSGVSDLHHLEGFGNFVLGQILHKNAHDFNSTASFVGEITNFNIWSYKRWSGDLTTISSTCGTPPVFTPDGNAISWNGLKNQTRNGNVMVTKRSCP